MIESVELIPILKTGNIFDEENKLVYGLLEEKL